MAGSRPPGPLCSHRVGSRWIDDGTLCRSRSGQPGPTTGLPEPSAEQAFFDSVMVYSMAPEARRKRAIDLQIIGGDYTRAGYIRLDNDAYLRELIRIGSGGRRAVRTDAGRALQFFVVRGGGEGLLPERLRDVDANATVVQWTSTSGRSGRTGFDENDILAVFDGAGKLVSAARLRRPTFVEGRIGRDLTRAVYDAWDGKEVRVYSSARPGWIPYLGLAVQDGYRDGSRGRKVVIDLHKQESTNGCILIVDPDTPADEAALREFEPELVLKVLKAARVRRDALAPNGAGVGLGTMHVVDLVF